MSEITRKQADAAKKTGAKAPTESGELDTAELDKVAGGMKPLVAAARRAPRLSADPCEGGE